MKKDLLLFAAFIFGVATTAGAAKNKAGERIDTLKARQLQEVQVIGSPDKPGGIKHIAL